MGNKIIVFKAEPIGDQIIEDQTIIIRGRLVPRHLTLGEVRAIHEEEARKLFDALFNSLPGGIFDQLAGLMLQKISSHLLISRAGRDPKAHGEQEAQGG